MEVGGIHKALGKYIVPPDYDPQKEYFSILPEQEIVLTKLSRNIFDITTGVLVAHGNWLYGLAVHHLTNPDESLIGGNSRLPRRVSSHVSYTMEISDEVRFAPSLFFNKQGNFSTLSPSVAFSFKNIRIGTTYSLNKHLAVMAGYNTNKFSVGYSYGAFLGGYTGIKSTVNEIHISTRFNCKNKEDKRKGAEQISF